MSILGDVVITMTSEPVHISFIKYPDPGLSNMLFLDRIEVLPQYRVNQIGLAALHHLIKRCSANTSLVALKAFPLQFEANRPNEKNEWREKMALSELQTNEKIATDFLCNHYSKLGFLKIPGTDYMVMAPTELPPNVKELIG